MVAAGQTVSIEGRVLAALLTRAMQIRIRLLVLLVLGCAFAGMCESISSCTLKQL